MLSYKTARGGSPQELYRDFVKKAARTFVRRRFPKPMIRNPNMIGSTDSTQSMKDFMAAREMGLAAGDVDRYRSEL